LLEQVLTFVSIFSTLARQTTSPTAITSARLTHLLFRLIITVYTLQQSDRIAVLDAMQDAGLKTLRIFITQVAENIKGCTNTAVNDVEVGSPGNWDDTILSMINTLISEAMPRGIKLIIAPHDRYALGKSYFAN
jgi:hypothetical protein